MQIKNVNNIIIIYNNVQNLFRALKNNIDNICDFMFKSVN
jgi:hypothetical protein